MVEQQKYSAVAHRGHRFFHPIPERKLRLLDSMLTLPPDARAVDFGCGRAEWLVLLTERHRLRAVGIDRCPEFLAWGLRRVQEAGLEDRIDLMQGDAGQHCVAADSLDLALCVGSGHVFGSPRESLAALFERVRPGGFALFGEGYWKREPAPEYLEALGDTRDALPDEDGLLRMADEAGWEVLSHVAADRADWDRYENHYREGVERYVRESPEDPDSPAMLERARSWFDLYRRHGRDTLGFAVLLLRKGR